MIKSKELNVIMPYFVRAGFTAADGGHSKAWQCSKARYTGYGDYDG